ncbi:MAG: TatD family hydrolase [Thermodesulfobacteriota bacterium]
MLIDTHVHLEMLEDIPRVIERARDTDVERIVAVSSDLISSNKTVEIAEDFPMVFTAVGIHPHEASSFDEEVLSQIEDLCNEQKVVAIGETGLDYHYMHSPRDIQINSFRRHIELAKKLDLPLIIHVRDAHDDVLKILKEEDAWETTGVIHSFTGDYETAKKYIDEGFYISFSGILTFKNAEDIRQAARKIPIERILIETDSPYLAPIPFRGKRNEPSYVKYVAEKIAGLRGIPSEKIEEETTANAKNLFIFEPPEAPTSIAYKLRDSLYLNITNRCTIACVFCGKWRSFMLRDFNLRIKKEPTVDEILDAAGNPTMYNEIVFVGWGEPLLRVDVVKEVSKKLKNKGAKKIRVDTDGLSNLVHKRNVLPDLKGLVDSISISLNAQDAETYARICPSKYGDKAYFAVLDFLKDAKNYIPDVTASVVTIPGVDVERCRGIVEDLGVKFKPRIYGKVG